MMFLAVLAIVFGLCQAASYEATMPITRMAFGSCIGQSDPKPAFKSVLAYSPDIFVFTGDNVYGDVTDGNLTELIDAYAVAGKDELFQAVVTETPIVMATWDDHDYGLNDAGAEFPYKEQTQEMFNDFWSVPIFDDRRMRPGIYTSQMFTDTRNNNTVQVIILDTRYFRDELKPADEPYAAGKERYVADYDNMNKTLLGDDQWAWLEEELKKPANIRVVVTSIQVIADGHGWEKWGNLPYEQERLYALINDTQANGVVFVSGDRHIGGLYMNPEASYYPIYEMTSSGITKFYSANTEGGSFRIGGVYGVQNWGSIDIDWWSKTVTMTLRNIAGESVNKVVIPFADIKADTNVAQT